MVRPPPPADEGGRGVLGFSTFLMNPANGVGKEGQGFSVQPPGGEKAAGKNNAAPFDAYQNSLKGRSTEGPGAGKRKTAGWLPRSGCAKNPPPGVWSALGIKERRDRRRFGGGRYRRSH